MDPWARSTGCRARLDRFYVRLQSYELLRCELVGTNPIEDDGAYGDEQYWPSDHFGVLLTLGVKARSDRTSTSSSADSAAAGGDGTDASDGSCAVV